jgi:hypothetical protein
MKNRNNKVTAVLFVVALALAPMVQATPNPQGGPSALRAAPTPRALPSVAPRPTGTPVNQDASENSEASGGFSKNLPVVTVYSTDNVIRGKTGTFVLHVKSALKLGGTYVNFSLSGTAVNGVDYKLVASPVYISQSGYGTIQIEALADPRGSAFNQAYSVIVTLNAGAGYAVGKASSAIMWIKPGTFIPPNS